MKIQEIQINKKEEIITFLKQENLLVNCEQVYIDKMELFLNKTNFYLRSNQTLEGLFLQQPKKEALLENFIVDNSLESFLDYLVMRKPKKIYLFIKKQK
ncbi:MAG: hypothetical protein WJU30_00388 [Candidatus Phytoplasma pruni]